MGMGEVVNQQINEKVQAGINEGMKKKIGEMVPLKLAEKGIDVDCVTLFTEDQVRCVFLFDFDRTITDSISGGLLLRHAGEPGHLRRRQAR